MGSRVRHPEGPLKPDGNPAEVRALRLRPRGGERVGEGPLGKENRTRRRVRRVRGATFLHEVVDPVDLVVPGAPVPVVVADEIKHPRTGDIERDVEIVAKLVEVMRGVRALVASAAVVGASHVGAGADPLVRPMVPPQVRVRPDRDDRRLRGRDQAGRKETEALGEGFNDPAKVDRVAFFATPVPFRRAELEAEINRAMACAAPRRLRRFSARPQRCQSASLPSKVPS